MTGGSDLFFGLKMCTLGIVLGQKIFHVSFLDITKMSFGVNLQSSISFFEVNQWIRKIPSNLKHFDNFKL